MADTPTSCILGPTDQSNLKHIISKESGATYNIENLNAQTFLVYHKSYRKGEQENQVLSMRNGKLYTAPKDTQSNYQKWTFKNTTDGYKVVVPYSESGNATHNVLQYDNGFLSIRGRGDYNGQKWILNNNGPSTNGVRMCALNNSNIQNNDTLDYIENQNLHENYRQQIGGILNLIQSNIQHFDKETRGKTDGTKVVSSVFGASNPVTLKVNVHGMNEREQFDNTRQATVLELLNKWEQ